MNNEGAPKPNVTDAGTAIKKLERMKRALSGEEPYTDEERAADRAKIHELPLETPQIEEDRKPSEWAKKLAKSAKGHDTYHKHRSQG